MRYLLSLILLKILLVPLAAQEVLLIGNSYTNGLVAQLQGFFASAPAGCQFTFTSITPGGQQLYTHSTTASTLMTINTGNFDHVVIQEQSQTHGRARADYSILADSQNFYEIYQSDFAIGETPNNTSFLAAAYWGTKQIIEAIQSANPDTQIHIFQTWGRDLSAASHVTWNTGTDAEKVARHLEQNILMARDAVFFDPTVKIARIGEAFQLSQATNPAVIIYNGDGSHANWQGSYLAAAMLFQQITGLPAIDSSFDHTLGPARAAHCKDIADSFYEEPPFELTDCQRNQANNEITLTWSCRPCTEYYIESSPDLQTWTEVVGTRSSTTANILSTTNTFADSGTRKFFRIARP